MEENKQSTPPEEEWEIKAEISENKTKALGEALAGCALVAMVMLEFCILKWLPSEFHHIAIGILCFLICVICIIIIPFYVIKVAGKDMHEYNKAHRPKTPIWITVLTIIIVVALCNPWTWAFFHKNSIPYPEILPESNTESTEDIESQLEDIVSENDLMEWEIIQKSLESAVNENKESDDE